MEEIGIDEMTVSEVKGYGQQNRHAEIYRSREYTLDFLPKLKIDLVVDDQNVERAVNAIVRSSRTGKMDGDRVYISDIKEAVYIRAEEKEETVPV